MMRELRTRGLRALVGAALLAGAVGCGTDAPTRAVEITATGTVLGSVVFDSDGSGGTSVGDVPVAGVRVRLLTPIARDTVLRATTSDVGTFQLSAVPVGTYVLVVDAASLGDTVEVRGFREGTVSLTPSDSVTVTALVTYPTLTAAAARSAAVGRRVFVQGIAMHGLATYSDTLLHLADSTGALRATRVRPSAVVNGDQVRLRGRLAVRDGQRVLDEVTVFVQGTAGFLPAAPLITSANAATALGGTLDAALVRVLDVAVVDTQTVLGSLRVRVSDGSGALVMLLDRAADATFRPPFAPGTWDVGRRFDVTGVLVPSAPGVWTLRPRSAFDLTPR